MHNVNTCVFIFVFTYDFFYVSIFIETVYWKKKIHLKLVLLQNLFCSTIDFLLLLLWLLLIAINIYKCYDLESLMLIVIFVFYSFLISFFSLPGEFIVSCNFIYIHIILYPYASVCDKVIQLSWESVSL